MPKYVMLTTLNDQGLQTLRANPERLKAVNRDVEELGAKVVHQWESRACRSRSAPAGAPSSRATS
jgi:uncharacterized protein with GYD domain